MGVPRDEQDTRFIRSFGINEVEEWEEFFREWGFVIIRDALSEEECRRTVDDMWTYLESQGWRSPEAIDINPLEPIDRSDPSTWGNSRWPGMAEEGILGTSTVWTPTALHNRQNPTIHKACAHLLQEEDLIVNHDRYGLFRPTLIPPNSSFDTTTSSWVGESGGAVEEKKFWKTFRNLHLDLNPWWYMGMHNSDEVPVSTEGICDLPYSRAQEFIQENGEVGFVSEKKLDLQALVNLADNVEEDGGFILVPKSHDQFQEWTRSTFKTLGKRFTNKRNNFVVLPEGEQQYNDAIRITMRAGSLLIWSQTMLHGSTPNKSSKPRYAQFFKVTPRSRWTEGSLWRRSALLRSMLEKREVTIAQERQQNVTTESGVLVLSDLGRRMFGLDLPPTGQS